MNRTTALIDEIIELRCIPETLREEARRQLSEMGEGELMHRRNSLLEKSATIQDIEGASQI